MDDHLMPIVPSFTRFIYLFRIGAQVVRTTEYSFMMKLQTASGNMMTKPWFFKANLATELLKAKVVVHNIVGQVIHCVPCSRTENGGDGNRYF